MRIEENLRYPVFHDDQHGTAIACLAAVIGALRFVKKDMKTAKFVVNGWRRSRLCYRPSAYQHGC